MLVGVWDSQLPCDVNFGISRLEKVPGLTAAFPQTGAMSKKWALKRRDGQTRECGGRGMCISRRRPSSTYINAWSTPLKNSRHCFR